MADARVECPVGRPGTTAGQCRPQSPDDPPQDAMTAQHPAQHEEGHTPDEEDNTRDEKGHTPDEKDRTRDDEDHILPDMEEAESSCPCPVCGVPAPRCCAGCRTVSYCGRAHQRRHWPVHRLDCRPYTVSYHPRLGRHLVATRALRRGDLILRDRPLMVGPCQETLPLCLGCYRPLSGRCRCRRCGWPLCSQQCEESGQHQAECDATARSPLGALCGQEGGDWYPCVSVLRLLELRETSPAEWTQLLELQSHDVERRGTEAYRLEQRAVVERVRSRFGQFQHSELLIHRVCGIMETNAYEIRLPEINVQGIYPRAALFEHDCVPNTHRTFDEDLTLVVRAAVDIAKGDHLTSIYTDNLWGTWQRREHLLNSKHFLCECARCADPTELGTCLSSLRCSQCQHGYIQPVDPLQSDCDYSCPSCAALVPGVPVRTTLDALEAEVEAVEEEPTITACEGLLRACSRMLHPNHHLMLDLTYPLVHLYNTSEPLPLQQLNRKEQLCKQLLSIADVLTPGISRLRGIILYELQQTLLQKARKLHKRKRKKNVSDAVNTFKEARQYLCEAVSVLRWEPRVQPEGQLGLEAAEELTQLDKWLQKHAPAAVGGADTDGTDAESGAKANSGQPGITEVTHGGTDCAADSVDGRKVDCEAVSGQPDINEATHGGTSCAAHSVDGRKVDCEAVSGQPDITEATHGGTDCAADSMDGRKANCEAVSGQPDITEATHGGTSCAADSVDGRKVDCEAVSVCLAASGGETSTIIPAGTGDCGSISLGAGECGVRTTDASNSRDVPCEAASGLAMFA